MFMLKLIICSAIVFISGYIGVIKSNKLKTREYILKEMATFLNLVKNEINYMMSILPNAYESARHKLVTELKDSIGQIVVDMLSCDSTYLMEQSIVKNICKIESLTEYDKNIFISTLKNLGRSDLEAQINIIENGITVIEAQIKEANESKTVNSKLYKTMGIISGLMLVIIFI